MPIIFLRAPQNAWNFKETSVTEFICFIHRRMASTANFFLPFTQAPKLCSLTAPTMVGFMIIRHIAVIFFVLHGFLPMSTRTISHIKDRAVICSTYWSVLRKREIQARLTMQTSSHFFYFWRERN